MFYHAFTHHANTHEGTDLVSTTIVLKFIISCEALNLLVLFYGTCFGHIVSKATQYATNDDKIFKDLAQLM
jgi:hypothetical protein